MASVSVKLLKSVQFAEGGALQQIVKQHYGPTVKRGGLSMHAEVQRATPRVSGHAQRGWTTGEPEWKGTRLIVRESNKVVYVPRVNRTSKRNRGFIARGYAQGRPKALGVLRAGVKALGPYLFKAGKV